MLRYPDRPEIHPAHFLMRPLFFAVLALLVSHNILATSILPVSMHQMLQASELVIEGVVVSIESRAEPSDPWKIRTWVTIRVIDTIKGSPGSDHITLSFLGGKVGDRTLAIEGMQVPAQGEHGIYFIEAPKLLQANPLYGWQQGHFLSEKDATGVERVSTSGKKPVYGIEARPSAGPGGLSDGTAGGLIVRKASVGREQPLSLEAFKLALREMLQ